MWKKLKNLLEEYMYSINNTAKPTKIATNQMMDWTVEP